MPNKTPKQTKKTPKKSVKEDLKLDPSAKPSKIASSFEITKNSFSLLFNNKKLFGLITLIYGLAYLILVQALSSPTSVSSIKSEFSGALKGHLSQLTVGINTFAYLLGSSTSTSSPSGSAYQVFIVLVVSLVIIWTLRQIYLGNKVRARDGYYRGLYPLIPFLLVILFIAIELIPLVLGLTLYNLVITGGIAVHVIEKVIWLIIIIGLVALSLYWIASSVFALYIVTLPDMTPMKALRSAKGLVKNRRWSVLRKVLFLPLMLIIVGGAIMLPIIILASAVAAWVFFILTLLALVVIHTYLYNLYRELIK